MKKKLFTIEGDKAVAVEDWVTATVIKVLMHAHCMRRLNLNHMLNNMRNVDKVLRIIGTKRREHDAIMHELSICAQCSYIFLTTRNL